MTPLKNHSCSIAFVCVLLLLTSVFGVVDLYAQSPNVAERIDSIMLALHKRQQFDGAILVTVAGRPIYRSALGASHSKKKFEPTTVCNIGSLAKGFTAMAIMMVAEQGKLTFDDPIIYYLPELNKFSNGITVRHLLTHTSGIPDVGDLGIDDAKLTNDKAIQALANLKSNFDEPGREYQYSNTGYLLLASIVERIVKQKFTAFVSARILVPLGMKNTSFIGRTAGMGDMESTVDDLSMWEESFYTEKLVRQSTLKEAFTPFPVKDGTTTYGFGWNIANMDGEKVVWHTGNADGYRAFIGRRVSEKIAVIILTAGDSKRIEINNAIVSVIHGKPYILPKMSIVDRLYEEISRKGIGSGIAFYDSLKARDSQNFDFGESELNSLGYKLLSEKKQKEAIEVFKMNTIAYPESSNGFDSLGEAYYTSGDIPAAIKCYEKALELDPGNLSSINMMKKLRK